MIQCDRPEKQLYDRESPGGRPPLNKEQRLFWAHGLRDLSHLAAAALIFGQAFAGKFSPWLFALGLAFLVVAYGVGHYILRINSKEGDQ